MSEAELLSDDRGGKGKIILAVVGLATLAAAGAYFATQGGGTPEASPAEAAAPLEFKAKSVIDDTQGPRGAKGQDVDRTPGTKIKKARRTGGGERRGGSDTNSQPTDSGSSRSTKLELSDSKNPLGN